MLDDFAPLRRRRATADTWYQPDAPTHLAYRAGRGARALCGDDRLGVPIEMNPPDGPMQPLSLQMLTRRDICFVCQKLAALVAATAFRSGGLYAGLNIVDEADIDRAARWTGVDMRGSQQIEEEPPWHSR